MIKNIVFDVGGVILVNATEGDVEKKLTYKEDAKIVYNELFFSEERKLMDIGTIDEEQAMGRILDRIPQRSRKEARDFFNEYMCSRIVTEGIPELLFKLREKGLNLYILSNFGKNFNDFVKINNMDFVSDFSGVFVSSNFGLVKPQKSVYNKFAEVFGVNPKECFFVDDKKQNVLSACSCGFRGCVFKTSDHLNDSLLKHGVF